MAPTLLHDDVAKAVSNLVFKSIFQIMHLCWFFWDFWYFKYNLMMIFLFFYLSKILKRELLLSVEYLYTVVLVLLLLSTSPTTSLCAAFYCLRIRSCPWCWNQTRTISCSADLHEALCGQQYVFIISLLSFLRSTCVCVCVFDKSNVLHIYWVVENVSARACYIHLSAVFHVSGRGEQNCRVTQSFFFFF